MPATLVIETRADPYESMKWFSTSLFKILLQRNTTIVGSSNFSCWTLASDIRLLIILLSLLDSSLEAMLIIAELPLIFLVKSNVHLFFGKAIRHPITADAMVLPRVIVNWRRFFVFKISSQVYCSFWHLHPYNKQNFLFLRYHFSAFFFLSLNRSLSIIHIPFIFYFVPFL